MTNLAHYDWLQGRASLGAAGGWTAEEIRLIADLGYALAEQGHDEEATTVFEGLAALAPATPYFQSALGALWLRRNEPRRAVQHLDAALAADPTDVAALVNRGEARLQLKERAAGLEDLEAAVRLAEAQPSAEPAPWAVRARALLAHWRSPLSGVGF